MMRSPTSITAPLRRTLQLTPSSRHASLAISTLSRRPRTLEPLHPPTAISSLRRHVPSLSDRLPRSQSLSSRSYSTDTSEPTSYRDDSHPSPIFYHPLRPSVYALSLLSSIPPSDESASIIAYLDLRSLEGDKAFADSPKPGSAEFNPAALARRRTDLVTVHQPFLDLLHRTLAECINQGDDQLETEAKLRGSGWAHLGDEREETAAARIPNPENIIASVAFVDGEVQPSSYSANDTYRIITREEGVMRLRSDWLEAVKKRCSEVEA